MTSWYPMPTAGATIPHSSCHPAPTDPPGRPSVRRRRVPVPSIHSLSPPTVRRCATSATPLSLNLDPTGARLSSYRPLAPIKARVRPPNRPPSCSLAPVSLGWVSLAASAINNWIVAIRGETACATTASHLLALVGHALACQRPLAGAFFHTF